MAVVMWWDDLWMSDEEKDAIESLFEKGVNREDVLWRAYLKEHPEAARHDWEKEYVRGND